MDNQTKLKRLQDENYLNRHHLIKSDVAMLMHKYGEYAYDMVVAALLHPALLKDNQGKGFKSSNQAISYFASHDISVDYVAEICRQPLDKIRQALADKPALCSQIKEEKPQPGTQQTMVQDTQQSLDKINGGDRAQQSLKHQTPSTNELIRQMSLDDYVRHCKAQDKPAPNYQALEEAAWQDFGLGEGLVPYLYLDHLGHATIGNGHLVLHKDHLYNEKKIAAYKKSFVDLPLLDADKIYLSCEEKERQFEALLTHMRQKTLKLKRIPYAGWRVVEPVFGGLNSEGQRYVFNKDFRFHYDRVKYDRYNKRVMFPNFEKFPLPVQLEVLHTLYAGQIGALYNRTRAHQSDLAVIHQAVYDTRVPIASYGEKQTIKKAGACLREAEQSFVTLALERYKENPETFAQAQKTAGHIAVSGRFDTYSKS